ncbi:diguanylate cyclase [Paenibacillus chitinolyticus]|uniref:Diguanylate cyclase n=2 Tax=Paenibacillus chitinolyticus TaxID=79263 RepID=A0A410X1S9_9BACL|nr:diguanylate cyclase [Paenibacillus chitinolyticus]QAV20572.1 diguanylate cyclase [Paenibacillus chitinolyticus]
MDFTKPWTRIKTGLATGAFGIVLMYFSIPIAPQTIVDFRGYAVLLAVHFGGIYSGFIAAVLIAAARIALFGGPNLSAFIGAANVLFIALAGGLVLRSADKRYWSRWTKMMAVVLVTTGAAIFSAIGTTSLPIMPVILGTLAVGGFFIGYMVDYIVRAHQLFLLMKEASHVDFLTGLNNHRTFDRLFNELVQAADRKQEELSLLTLDIDYFKKINDTYGHPAGDAVLQQIGVLLRDSSRRMDEVCRTGGEEFAVLLPDCGRKEALHYAEQIRSRVERHSFLLGDGKAIRLTISIGAATFPQVSPDLLIEEADKALYRAKHNGRNQVA